jgi:tetratricopeptide (TPR) repeat protein
LARRREPEILDYVVEVLATARILLVVNYRPAFTHAWTSRSFYHQIQVGPLAERQAAELTDALLGPQASTSPLRDGLLARTDGNPFFIEECVRALAEAGALSGEPGFYRIARPSDRIVLPDTVQAVIAARIDGLPAGGRELLQVAAVVGNEAPLRLLGAAAGLDDDRLREALADLQSAELLVETVLGAEPAFRFKHALVQDAAYGTLLRAGRRELHGRIARILEDRYAATVEPALLAHHWQEAGALGQALAWWTVAGDAAERRAATREAAAHYRAALALVHSATLPADRRAREPELWMKLGNALMQVEGYASADAADAYRRARTAALALDQPESFARAGIGMAPLLFGDCRYREVLDILGENAGHMLDRLTPRTQIQHLATLSVANYNVGEFAAAWRDLGKACALDRETPYTHEDLIGGADPAIAARAYAVQAGEALGKIEQCLRFGEEAVAIARERNHPFTLAWAHQVAARAFHIAGRYDASIANGNAAVAICEQHGFHLRLGTVLMLRGAALCGRGDTDRGLAEVRRGLALWRKASGIFEMTQNLSGLAECLLQAGFTDEAAAAVSEAEQIAADTDERSHCGELLRLRGILSSFGGETDRAIGCLKRAIEWARAHQARMHELRAARDLARLFADHVPESIEILESVVAQFPPLLNAPDLRQARAVLSACSYLPHPTETSDSSLAGDQRTAFPSAIP